MVTLDVFTLQSYVIGLKLKNDCLASEMYIISLNHKQ